MFIAADTSMADQGEGRQWGFVSEARVQECVEGNRSEHGFHLFHFSDSFSCRFGICPPSLFLIGSKGLLRYSPLHVHSILPVCAGI